MRSLIALVLVLALAALAPAAQAGERASTSVINGEDASIADFPSLAFIESRQSPQVGSSCTGSVIAPRVILTAGHCILDSESGRITPAKSYGVATGVADLRQIQEENVFGVSRALVYPKYDPGTGHGDAGLLILSKPTTAPPIAMATGADAALYKGGDSVRIAGWGRTAPNASDIPPVLQTTTAVVQTPTFCGNHVLSFYSFYSPGQQLCTTTPPRHVSSGCFGDSGGPLIAQRADGTPVEIGIVSMGSARCKTTLPNIFARADRIAGWAGEWIAAVEQGAPQPVVKVPKAVLPRMTKPEAKELVALAMGYDFGRRFRGGKEKRLNCQRITREKYKCGITWWFGPNDYFGTVTVFYAIQRNSVTWNARYTIQWVNDRCWFKSGNRKSCEIHSKHR